MRVHILSPLATVYDHSDITQLSARDDSGAFAIRSGHAPFMTVLPPCVVTLARADGGVQYAAVAGGLLRVGRDGVLITSPDAVAGDDLAPLAARVETERKARQYQQQEGLATEHKLHAALMHRLLDSVAAERGDGGRTA